MFQRRKKRIYFGWWIVLVTGVLSGLGFAVYDFGASAFFKPIASELKFSRTSASVASGIGRLGMGVGGPPAGWLVDRFGPKWVIFTSLCIAIAGMTAMYFVHSLWSYYIVWGLIVGTGIYMAAIVPVDKTLANWFIKRRGIAQGIKFSCMSILGVIILPILTWQVAEYGWRMTCLTWSAIWLAITPFILWIVKQQRPEYYGLLPDGARVESGAETDIEGMINRGVEYASGLDEVEFTFRQAFRTPAYWMLVVSMLCNSIVLGGFNLHCIPFLTDRGIPLTTAGAMMGMMVFFTAPSRLIGGLVADRIRKNRIQYILAGTFFLQIIGMLAFVLNQSTATIYVMLIFYGLGSGALGPVFLTILGRYFGRKAYGSIMGTLTLFSAPVQLGSPVFAGWIYDTTGEYIHAFIVYIATTVLSVIILMLLKPPKAPEKISGIRQFI